MRINANILTSNPIKPAEQVVTSRLHKSERGSPTRLKFLFPKTGLNQYAAAKDERWVTQANNDGRNDVVMVTDYRCHRRWQIILDIF